MGGTPEGRSDSLSPVLTLNLTMCDGTLRRLRQRAAAHDGRTGAFDALCACVKAERTGALRRVRLTDDAVEWLERWAPDLAALWPHVLTTTGCVERAAARDDARGEADR